MGCVSLCCDKLRTFQYSLTHVFRAKALRLAGNSNALTPQTHVNDSPNRCKWAVNCDVLSRKYRFSSLFIPLMHPVSIVNFSISPLDTCYFIDTFLGQKCQSNEPKMYENNSDMPASCRCHLLGNASHTFHSQMRMHGASIRTDNGE